METDTTYTPPAILDDMDEDSIHARMLTVIPDNLDKTEGGFVYDFTMPTAIEKADAMILLNEIVQLFFPEWSSGEFLDKLGRAVALTRKAATASETTLTITGVANTLIPEGFLFSTAATAISNNVEFAALEDVVLDANGDGQIPVRCTETGTVGNVSANSILLMASPMAGIISITNAAAATGGTDEESDEEFSARIMDRERDGDSSFVGCDADYKRWAQEVDGVGAAIVVPEWDGPGTVKVIVMDANGEPATATIIGNVYDHIISPDDRQLRLAPIGATLTVTTASILSLTITADVVLDADATVSDVTDAFKANLAPCFEEAMREGTLRLTRVGAVLSKTAGVVDYENLLIDGSADNITVNVDEYPVATTITLTPEASI
jgi:uncharacterized phage protein gp47/JayE